TMTVLASPEIARPPKRRFGLKGPGAVNVACRVHVPPLRVKTTIPVPLSTSAVLPSPDNATGPDATSNCPLVSGATPCWLQPFGPADEHPGRSRAGAVGPPAPEGGVAVARNRDVAALLEVRSVHEVAVKGLGLLRELRQRRLPRSQQRRREQR